MAFGIRVLAALYCAVEAQAVAVYGCEVVYLWLQVHCDIPFLYRSQIVVSCVRRIGPVLGRLEQDLFLLNSAACDLWLAGVEEEAFRSVVVKFVCHRRDLMIMYCE